MKRDLHLFAAALVAGFAVEHVVFHGSAALAAWLAARDVEAEWWALHHVEETS